MSTQEQRTLRRLREKLRRDCSLLVEGTYLDVERDNGNVTRQQIPGLIRQLAAAIAHGREQRRKLRRQGGLPIVISVHAFDIMANIDNVTKQWSRSYSILIRISNTVAELCTRSVEAIPDMRIVSRYLDSWVRLINELFEPPKRMTLAAPCPECRQSTVRLWHMGDNEYVLQPALQITRKADGHICECFSCGATWPDTHFLLLAQVLGCEAIA